MHQEHEDYCGDETMGHEARQQHRKMKMNRSGFSLTQEQKLDLIDHIHQRPHLWDQSDEGFRSSQTRQAAFNEVSQLLSNDEETLSRLQVQEEWGKLRYCFTRIVKKLLEDAPNGQITEEQLATISWAFFRRMSFLLDSVVQQLHGPGQQATINGGIDGGGGGAEWAAAQLLNQQENMQSDHSPIRGAKFRRRRRHHNANGDINSELSRKSSNEFVAEEMDDGNAADANNALLNQSTNELLMRQVLGLNAPDLLMANALSTSQQLIQHFQQSADTLELKREMGGGGEENASGGDGMSITALINDAVGHQQQHHREQQQMPMPTRNLRRKKRGSNLDFLLGTVAQQQSRRRDQQILPMAASTPAKQSTCSPFLANGIVNWNQSPLMNQTIASNLTMEGSQFGGNNSMAGTSPNGQKNQQRDGTEERTVGTLTMANGDEFNGELSGNNARGGGGQSSVGGDIIESFGHYIVQQLKAVHKKSEMLSVEMRKELVNLCFDYEMRACKMAASDGNDDKDSGN